MKYPTPQNIQYFKRRSSKIIKRRERLNKRCKKRSNRHRVGRVRYEGIDLPIEFNLSIQNIPQFVQFIAKIKAMGSRYTHLKLNLENIVRIDIGAITILLSVIKDLNQLGVKIKGNMPKDLNSKETLLNSGFFQHLSDSKKHATKNIILCTGDAETRQSELAKEIPKVIQTVWGFEGRYPPLYECIVEMMRNSCDHAFAHRSGIRWHFAVYHIEQENRVLFSFVDNGKGVIQTLRRGKLRRMLQFFKDDAEILYAAYDKGHDSRTGLDWRGKGLPTILENSTNSYICNLKVLTNEVYIDFDKRQKKMLPGSFAGTCYLWEINMNCTQLTLLK